MNLAKNKLIIYSLIVAFLGFIDSTYLTILHYKNIIPPCTVTSGCETVLTSKYSMIGPIPVSLTGTLFYLAVIAVCLLLLTSPKKWLLNALYGLSLVGFVVSLILIYIQAALLHAFCQYCLLSEITSVGILILALLEYRKNLTSKV